MFLFNNIFWCECEISKLHILNVTSTKSRLKTYIKYQYTNYLKRSPRTLIFFFKYLVLSSHQPPAVPCTAALLERREGQNCQPVRIVAVVCYNACIQSTQRQSFIFMFWCVWSSICSGLVAATLGTPADVIKTRIMNQPRDKHGRYVSTFIYCSLSSTPPSFFFFLKVTFY